MRYFSKAMLVASAALCLNLSVYSQDISLKINNVTVKEAMERVKKDTGYSFIFSSKDVNTNQRVSVSVSDASIEEVIKQILKGQQGLDYEIQGKKIVLRKAQPVSSQESQEKKAVSGKVLDTNGEPVIGATIMETGTTNGTITDFDGNFTLSVANGVQLEVSYVGFQSQVLKAIYGRSLTITLKEDTEVLDEVVITGFGLAQKKATLTGAVSSLGSDDISRSSSVNTSGALVGKIAGLNFRASDSRPGNTTALQIRNMGTPLFVIDGIQSDEGQFNNIDFNDIESISVLKDASASIYGVRAANGVIVVNTKKGRKQSKNTVSLNTYYGWQHVSRLPKPADAVTYIENYIQSETIQGRQSYTYDKEDLEKWKQGTDKGYVPFDWYKYIWVTSPQYYVNANVSGGTDKTNYYFSIGHTNQESAIRNYGGMKRYNVQMNIETQITNKFKIGMTMNGRIKQLKNPGVPGTDDYNNPTIATYRNLPTIRPFANDNPDYPASVGSDNGLNFGLLNYEKSGTFEDTWRMAQLSLNAEYEIIKGLKAKALLGYYYASEILNNQEYTYRVYRYDEANDTYVDVGGRTSAWRERRNAYVEELSSNIQLSYEKKIYNNNINAVVGFEAIKRNQPSSWLHSIPASNALHLIYYDTIDKYDDVGNNTQARLGWLGRFNYDYAGKYLIEFSARYDGSWKFPPNHRWGFFPSASLGWRISEENFFKSSKLGSIIDNFKLRGSYGLVGDDNVDGYNPFDYMSGYNYKDGGGVIDGNYIIGTSPRNLPVTTLSWAKAKILDIGIDLAFLNNRLSSSIDYFRRIKTGIPASRDDVLLPEEVGFERPKENLNSNVHTGYDAIISWHDQVNEFFYSIGANFTYSRFYNWEQYNPKFSNSWDEYRNSAWHRFGDINWGYEADGQFQSWEEISSWPIDNDQKGNTTLRPGDIKYVDQNGDGIINDMDKRPIGYKEDSTPVMNFGLNFMFKWKGFDLALDFTGAAMSTWNPTAIQRIPFNNNGNNPAYIMEDTWHLSDIFDKDSELIPGKYPTLIIGNNSNNHSNYWDSSFWKYNVRYLKLRNLEFGYTFPNKWLNKVKISNLRLYLAGQNLFTLTNVPIDPEVSAGNGSAYPSMRIINIGLNLKF